MRTVTTYVVIEAKVRIPDKLPDGINTPADAVEDAINGMDYNLTYKQDGIEILETEVLGQTDECPI